MTCGKDCGGRCQKKLSSTPLSNTGSRGSMAGIFFTGTCREKESVKRTMNQAFGSVQPKRLRG
jgi:hypothetical protein